MKLFEGIQDCACGNTFPWRYAKMDEEKIIVYRQSERMQNCKNYHETECQYIFEIVCPHCGRRQFVESAKEE